MKLDDDREAFTFLYFGTSDYGGAVERLKASGWEVPEQIAQAYMVEGTRVFTKIAVRNKEHKVVPFDPIADLMKGTLRPYDREESNPS